MKKNFMFSLGLIGASTLALTLPIIAHAADAVSSPAFADAAMSLYKLLVGHAPLAAIVVGIVELLKSDLLGGLLLKLDKKHIYIPILMTAMTGVAGAANAVMSGKSLLNGIVEGFLTSGIAMSMYTSIKSIKSGSAPVATPSA